MGKTRHFSNDKTTYYDVYYQKKQNLTTSGYISNTTITYNTCINPNFKLACRCCKKTIVIFEDYETYIQRNFPYTNDDYKIICDRYLKLLEQQKEKHSEKQHVETIKEQEHPFS